MIAAKCKEFGPDLYLFTKYSQMSYTCIMYKYLHVIPYMLSRCLLLKHDRVSKMSICGTNTLIDNTKLGYTFQNVPPQKQSTIR